jgi:hypothetical protein
MRGAIPGQRGGKMATRTSGAIHSVSESTKLKANNNPPVGVALGSADATAELIEVGKRIATAFERIATALEHKAK